MGIHTLFLIYSALVIVIVTSIFALPTAYPRFLKCFTKNKEKSTLEANGESKSSNRPNGELNNNAESEDGNTSNEEENGDGDISNKGEDEALVATIQNIVAKLWFLVEATKHFDKLLVQVAKTMFLTQGLTSIATTNILRKHFCI
jgi:cytoskeletal protein RodZ